MASTDPVCRIVRRTRWVNGKLMEHSDVLIEWQGRHYASRVWWVIDDTPHMRAAQVQDFLRRQRARDAA